MQWTMGTKSLIIAALAGAGLMTACQKGAAAGGGGSVTLNTEEQKTIYALGLFEGQRVKVFSLTPEELTIMKQGLTDAASGAKAKVELSAYQPKLQELYQARQKLTLDHEKDNAKKVVADAEKEPGAQKLPSGLIYRSLKDGNGPSPTATDIVKVNYEGKLPDGTVFDSSYKRNQPAEFPLTGVIKCWTEGVQKMKTGGKAKLTCPSDAAYGDRGSPPSVPGGATLIFEIELLEVKAAPPPAAAAMGAPTAGSTTTIGADGLHHTTINLGGGAPPSGGMPAGHPGITGGTLHAPTPAPAK